MLDTIGTQQIIVQWIEIRLFILKSIVILNFAEILLIRTQRNIALSLRDLKK